NYDLSPRRSPSGGTIATIPFRGRHVHDHEPIHTVACETVFFTSRQRDASVGVTPTVLTLGHQPDALSLWIAMLMIAAFPRPEWSRVLANPRPIYHETAARKPKLAVFLAKGTKICPRQRLQDLGA